MPYKTYLMLPAFAGSLLLVGCASAGNASPRPLSTGFPPWSGPAGDDFLCHGGPDHALVNAYRCVYHRS